MTRKWARDISSRCAPSSFNGAASWMTRKSEWHVNEARRVLLQWGRVMDDAEMNLNADLRAEIMGLQWGRVMDDAEINFAGALCLSSDKLQWGRIMDDAEMIDQYLAPALAMRFNGAASWMTRKSASQALPLGQLRSASMGPRHG